MPQSLTVLLPFYNPDLEHFKACIASLNAQTFQGFKVLFVDDHSAVEVSDAWLEAHLTVPFEVVRLNRNLGVGGALNAGLERVGTPFLARMDADDLCLPERFEAQLAFLKAHPEVGALGCQAHRFGNRNVRTRFPLRHAEMAASLPFELPFLHPTLMFRVSALGSARYSEAIPAGEGFPLWAELIQTGVRFANLPAALFRYRMHGANHSRASRNDRCDRFAAIQALSLPILFRSPPEVFDELIQSGALNELAFQSRTDSQPLGRRALKQHAQVLLDGVRKNPKQFEGESALRKEIRKRLFWNSSPSLHKAHKVVHRFSA